jgi:hypothetical protein
MAVRPASAVGRLAVERARVRMPELAPDSVEVVELVRAKAFVIARSAPSRVVVLDERGRLVRSPARLAAIGRHLGACTRLREWAAAASLPQRLDAAAAGAAAIERVRAGEASAAANRHLRELRARLDGLANAIGAVREELHRTVPPTERTLRRAVALANDAAEADRGVVRAIRVTAASLACEGRLRQIGRGGDASLTRWLIARLHATDIPFLYAELYRQEDADAASAFVVAARTSAD